MESEKPKRKQRERYHLTMSPELEEALRKGARSRGEMTMAAFIRHCLTSATYVVPRYSEDDDLEIEE